MEEIYGEVNDLKAQVILLKVWNKTTFLLKDFDPVVWLLNFVKS